MRSTAGPASAPGATPGPDATDAENNAKLLAALDGLPPAPRARATCASSRPGRPRRRAARRAPVVTRAGRAAGRIATEPAGTGGFGYDPIFEPRSSRPVAGRSAWSAAEKNAISHRARAARRMSAALATLGVLMRARLRLLRRVAGNDPAYAALARSSGGARPARHRPRLRRRPGRAHGRRRRCGAGRAAAR